MIKGSSYSLSRKCYGGPFDFPYYATPPLFKGQISYTPKGGVQRIVVNDGEVRTAAFNVNDVYYPFEMSAEVQASLLPLKSTRYI